MLGAVIIQLLALLFGLHAVTSSVTPTVSYNPAHPSVQVISNPSSANTNDSLNWAGYQASGGTFTGVSGTWTVPQNSGSGRYGADATWVGIGGIASRDLIQAGTQQTVGRSGAVSYQAFYETLPQASQPLNVSVNGGDSVTVSLNQQPDGTWLISFKDNTNGQSTQMTTYYDSSLSSAEWIEEAPSSRWTILPLDNFGTINFSNASAIKNGQTVNLAQANAQPITMGLYNQALATPSGVGGDGASFNITRTSLQTAPLSTRAGIATRRFRGFGVRVFRGYFQ